MSDASGTPSAEIDRGLPAEVRAYAAELIGTFVLVLVGPGTAVLASDVVGPVGVSLAFGLALVAMAYTIGHVSGCHINPAVTLAFWSTRAIDTWTAIWYVLAQIVGACLGGLAVYAISDWGDLDTTGVFASNGWGDVIGSPFGIGSVMVVEVLFTALLVVVVLATTTVGYPTGFGGLVAGLTLSMIHLATIPVDNTSVNPARSLGTAIFAGTDELQQMWAFIVFPLVGAVLGVFAHRLVHAPATD
jgi:aquaporin Z